MKQFQGAVINMEYAVIILQCVNFHDVYCKGNGASSDIVKDRRLFLGIVKDWNLPLGKVRTESWSQIRTGT
jgi:hypothetical protein